MLIKERLQEFKSILGVSLSFAKANFKLRNEGSYLGILWYLLEPILFLIILLAIRGVNGNGKVNYYPVFLFLGLIMYNFFMNITTNATTCIQSKSKFVKNMVLPKEPLVLSTVIQFIFSHLFELIILVVLMIYFKVNILALWLYLPIFAIFLIFTIGVSFILATMGVFINDLKNVWSVFSRLLFFITPIYYDYNAKGSISLINYINPLTHFLNISREIVIYQKMPALRGTILIVLISLITFALGIFIFNKYKRKFAEEI